MNKLIICTIYDSKAEAYLVPFTMRSEAEAVRAFGDHASQAGTPVNQHPEDYFLYKVGSFDQNTGVITACDKVSLAAGSDFVKKGE